MATVRKLQRLSSDRECVFVCFLFFVCSFFVVVFFFFFFWGGLAIVQGNVDRIKRASLVSCVRLGQMRVSISV